MPSLVMMALEDHASIGDAILGLGGFAVTAFVLWLLWRSF